MTARTPARDDYPNLRYAAMGGSADATAALDEIDTLRRHTDAVIDTWIVKVNLAGGPWTNDRTHEWNAAARDHQEALEALRGVRADFGTENPDA